MGIFIINQSGIDIIKSCNVCILNKNNNSLILNILKPCEFVLNLIFPLHFGLVKTGKLRGTRHNC